MTHQSFPKPILAKKKKRGISKFGGRQLRYWSWLQAVVYPALWFRDIRNSHGLFGAVPFNPTKEAAESCTRAMFRAKDYSMVILNGEHVGKLTLLDKPDQHGRWWIAEGFHVDHVLPRAHRPDLVYSLDNIQLLTPEENRVKGSSHE